MKEIKLKKITLGNWRSLNLSVDFNDGKTMVHGKNELGKSSLFHAWCWLMSGFTDSDHAQHYNLYDENKPLSEETPTASVRANISISGIDYILERTAKPTFRFDKVNNAYVKGASDTYKLYIDDIEVSNTHWQEFIATNICEKDMLVFLLSGTFLSTLAIEDKDKARKVFLNLVGEILDSEYKGDYSCLKPYIAKGYSMKQIEEMAKKRISELDKEIGSIPHKIDANENIIAEYSTNDFSELRYKANDIKNEINVIDDEMLYLSKSIDSQVAKQNEELSELKTMQIELSKKEEEYDCEYNAKRRSILNRITDIENENRNIVRSNYLEREALEEKKNRVAKERSLLNMLNEERNKLIAIRDEIKARVFTDDKCAYCGQELPIDKLEAKKTEFLQKKDLELSHIVAKGKNVRSEIEEKTSLIERLEKEIELGVTLKEEVSTDSLKEELNKLEASHTPFSSTAEYAKLHDAIEIKKSNLTKVEKVSNQELNVKKNEYIRELESINQILGLELQCEKLKKEIEQLNEKRRSLGNELVNYKRIEMKAKEYIEEQANIVSNKINARLNGVTVEMFRTQKNGERVPDCTIRGKKGVRYATINNSAKTLINIELQKMMMKHYNVTMPVWIDECKNFDTEHTPNIEGQSIMLYASDSPYICVE